MYRIKRTVNRSGNDFVKYKGVWVNILKGTRCPFKNINTALKC